MPSLKDLRGRINSVKSTRKITQAMKMVAAAKLRRAQSQAEAARPYAERMEAILASLGAAVAATPGAPRMLVGTGADRTHLLVVVTADRGLAGAFNTNAARLARSRVRALEAEGKSVKLLTVGRKGAANLRRDFADRIVGEVSFVGKKRVEFSDAEEVAVRIAEMLESGGFDVCTLVYNRFRRRPGRPRPPTEAPRPSTNTSRWRRRSSPRSCRATSPSRYTARSWRTRPASTGAR